MGADPRCLSKGGRGRMESLNGRTKAAGQVQKGLRHREKGCLSGSFMPGVGLGASGRTDCWLRQMVPAGCQVDTSNPSASKHLPRPAMGKAPVAMAGATEKNEMWFGLPGSLPGVIGYALK